MKNSKRVIGCRQFAARPQRRFLCKNWLAVCGSLSGSLVSEADAKLRVAASGEQKLSGKRLSAFDVQFLYFSVICPTETFLKIFKTNSVES